MSNYYSIPNGAICHVQPEQESGGRDAAATGNAAIYRRNKEIGNTES